MVSGTTVGEVRGSLFYSPQPKRRAEQKELGKGRSMGLRDGGAGVTPVGLAVHGATTAPCLKWGMRGDQQV